MVGGMVMADSNFSIASLGLTQTAAWLADLSYITERRGIASDTWATAWADDKPQLSLVLTGRCRPHALGRDS